MNPLVRLPYMDNSQPPTQPQQPQNQTNQAQQPVGTTNQNSQAQPQQTPAQTTQNSGTSQQTRTIVTIVVLFFFSPVGIILMWFWSKWKLWVKILLTFIFFIIPFIVAAILIVAIDPAAQVERAECSQNCMERSQADFTFDYEACTDACAE